AGLAERAARGLPDGEALLLRGNGALTLGAAPGLAVARMWLLGVACDVYLKALAAAGANPVTPLSAGGISSWRAVSGALPPPPPGTPAAARRPRSGRGRRTGLAPARRSSASTRPTGRATGPARRT